MIGSEKDHKKKKETAYADLPDNIYHTSLVILEMRHMCVVINCDADMAAQTNISQNLVISETHYTSKASWKYVILLFNNSLFIPAERVFDTGYCRKCKVHAELLCQIQS